MTDLRFLTAGESHGKALVAVLEGVPAGLPLTEDYIARDLRRRQGGYGRSKRQQLEQDHAEIVGGVRHGLTLGGPIAMLIQNRVWEDWQEVMQVGPYAGEPKKVTRLRPGHADLAGSMKYGFDDARNVLERASARETAARVAAGALAKILLRAFGTEIASHVIAAGKVRLGRAVTWQEISAVCANLESPLRCVDAATEERMKAEVDQALRAGDSVGGIFEVVAHNVVPGLGNHAQWDEKLDGLLARAVMSIQAVKGVEIGSGVSNATSYGSEVQDEIRYDAAARRFRRPTNRAGGLEGGITNGEDVVVRGYLKPISTLRRAMETADLKTKTPVKAAYERSDICVVPAAGVAGEAMTALVLAGAFLQKFGGDSIAETKRNFESYQRQLDAF